MELNRWNQLLERLDLKPDPQTYQALVSAYSEKHRRYHTGKHINHCLAELDRNRAAFDNPDEVEVALWFHDAIYRTRSSSNEVDSAEWAVEFLTSEGAANSITDNVKKLIIATKHDVVLNCNDDMLLVDIDLAILGSDAKTYEQFEKDVRYEYRIVPNFVFRKKRAEILRSFLDREFIYHTERFRESSEQNARVNLEMAVNQLLS